uniref:NADH-ubiquinone oxidoreductase chain 3 n=1 Tax=Chrysochroa fulgidissima TaxID=543396 RepID=C5H683_9COLE|nr:NADH dehydrogenase subunit 3 [Chrysochroa fulgidissima]ACF04025.1 NADH dehydrogenase subunit 3 [Chrysochroa fulgidissima]
MMMMIFSTSIIILMLSMVVMSMASLLSKKTFSDREKNSPFECGFDPTSSARVPFSLQFFLIAVIFLIFDVEITLLLPLIFSLKLVIIQNYLMITILFIFILLIGLYHEWKQGALNWAI